MLENRKAQLIDIITNIIATLIAVCFNIAIVYLLIVMAKFPIEMITTIGQNTTYNSLVSLWLGISGMILGIMLPIFFTVLLISIIYHIWNKD